MSNTINENPDITYPVAPKSTNLLTIIEKKIVYLQNIVTKTILAIQKYKSLDIIGSNEYNISMSGLENIFTSLHDILFPIQNNQNFDSEQHINKLQDITVELSGLFKTYGTEHIDDLITICFGSDFIKNVLKKKDILDKYLLMKKYVHPIGYKSIPWKEGQEKNKNILHKNRIVEDFMIVESSSDLECFDLARTSKAFQTKVYGLKFAVHNTVDKKTLIISAVIDEVMLKCLNFKYIQDRLESIRVNKPKETIYDGYAFETFVNSLTIKELLVYENDKLYLRFSGYITQLKVIKQKTISQVTKEFINNDLYSQRTTIIQLLVKSNEHEYQYLSYLLYDLLSNDNNGSIDSVEQTLLFDSLPWNMKKHFRNAMKQTVNYTNYLTNFDTNKIPLEQQICLLKTSDSVKEKAMVKLKEVKAKSEDTGAKARQYLEGLLKIPFGIYRNEPILNVVDTCTASFNSLIKSNKKLIEDTELFPIKESYTSAEIFKYSSLLNHDLESKYKTGVLHNLVLFIDNTKRTCLIDIICFLNTLIKKHGLKVSKLCHSGKKAAYMREKILSFVGNNDSILYDLCVKYKIIVQTPMNNIKTVTTDIIKNNEIINDYMINMKSILDEAIHGHTKAKRQIERIVGQWINGENSGYCFGFEGPPGVGKTSLAKKGIAKCLTCNEGIPRPFALIAIGGSSNGSILDGHNYTYVGSTWGKIVDILIEKKCMNPIIFIDELCKISQTENGKELIGILTHLIDPTQNDSFQDKYFNGIDLDLSKTLFIFSYNDANKIDKILLDRIHRIKFDFLTLENKLTITKNYLLPEIFKKMGVYNIIEMNDKVIEYIIYNYTCEPGVRKLKEILFEIVGEINLSILNSNYNITLPIHITEDDVKYKYLKEKHAIRLQKIHKEPKVGVITGLWANSMGQGGVLPIEAAFFPCNNFLDLKLTGMQGDVMKESMLVAKTLSWSLLKKQQMIRLQKEMSETKYQGLHIHVPEGATPKDGPSAGVAITIALYSLLSKKKIKNNVAITGEICLQGKVTAIGGLDLKIIGGIHSGVDTFIYPEQNNKEYDDFMTKYKDNNIIEGISFHAVSTIDQVLKLVF